MVKRRKSEVVITPNKSFKRITSLDSLPEEILIKISSYLNQNDTLSLLYTNKIFNKPCKLRLYKQIIICEKYQDTYFYLIGQFQHKTLLSSWNKILKFFKHIYMSIKNGNNLKELGLIEEISSYNYLDCGKLDPHRFLLKSDLNNLLFFRQYWEFVINKLINLKKFIFPKLPIEKLYSIDEVIKLNLLEVCINLDDDFINGPLSSLYSYENTYHENTLIEEKVDLNLINRSFKLPKLTNLRLNLEIEDGINDVIIGIIISILRTSTDLKSLELNGNFGKLDRDLEHGLRHHNFNNDVSLKSSFLQGFTLAQEIYDEKPSNLMQNDEITFKINQLVEKIPNGIIDYDIVDNDEVYNNLEFGNIEGDGSFSEDDDEEEEVIVEDEDYNDYLERRLKFAIRNVPLEKKGYDGFKQLKNTNVLFEIFHQFFLNSIDLTNLTNLKIANISITSINPYLIEETRELFSKLTNLKTLELINLQNHESLDIEYVTISKILSELPLVNLENVTFASTSKFNQSIDELDNFARLISNSPNLQNLKFIASSKDQNLNSLFNILKFINQPASKLTKIIYVKPDEILIHARRLINIKIFKRFKNFHDLKLIDDYYFGISKKLIEHFNLISRIDNYGIDEFKLNYKNFINFDREFIFNEEFKYLFKDEVGAFFRICVNLKEFVYFGYTFYKSDFT